MAGKAAQQRQDDLAMMEKAIQRLAYRHNVYTVFDDFVAMAALALSNAVDLAQRQARETRSLQIVQRYTKEEMAQFPPLLGLLVAALEERPLDVLGVLYHRLELHNEHAGQCFTPYAICLAMAQMLVQDAKRLVETRGFIRALEPCVGSGAMIIALAQACQAVGVHYQKDLHVTAMDLDATAVHMASVQLALLGIPAVVCHGDTLRGECRAVWSTPAHVFDLWSWRLRQTAPEAPTPPSPPAPAVAPAWPVGPVGTQLTLFSSTVCTSHASPQPSCGAPCLCRTGWQSLQPWLPPWRLPCYTPSKTFREGQYMHMNGLPTDLAQFVDEVLASGAYPSAEALVCEALQVLRAQRHPQGVSASLDPPAVEGFLQSPDDYLHALAQALRTGEFGRARQLATEGAARYPAHAELAKSAYVLAPPTVVRTSRPHTANIRANRTWLKAHRQAYAGQWVAIRDGYFLAAALSFEALEAQVDATPDVLMTQLPA